MGCDLLLGKYAILVFNKEFPYIIVRNWLFVGIPYFTIGNIIRQKYYIIEKRVSLLWTSGSVVIFSLTSFLERYLLVITEMNAKRDHYLSTTFLAIALFLLFVYCLNNHESFVSRLGHRDSTWIYILHYLFIGGIGVIARRIGMEHVYSLVKPVVVFFFTVIAIEFANVVLRCLILKNSK